MLFKVPIFACLASLAVADFDMFWFAENVLDVGVGAERYSSIKFLNEPPNCKDFVNGAQMKPGFGGDVSDSKHGGIACDGCPVNKAWKEWTPSRVEVHDYNKQVFANGAWHFSECICI
ncbi:hypothetical protein HBH56_159140 [Parastagonospora nodorum]|uniref:Uncharacterized protein n=1 Tax=Phaeosphaeria nodorum (strain SN15 / ATCC MYA-4574 / FGSC 10173) TaxID=321614 RepID=A0A7U2F234_PHANO|nr:hypothetical protein HBH56_159140 [Parastagonospora nodorum]QRC97331.1 hypothetical protein JI435_088860 [Parastagonospora nodorum SN15]KAH3922466.1 hypothetical protein HBH54_223570 [Parastagonospora nodorum]KAH3946985.1 hypothetical protein HBH53_122760 [Parastagonospora nodorum]KAH3973616.1 hypothetical protein HBH51_095960 [Parastagonospora nodorum]